jgi:hypothetical protein
MIGVTANAACSIALRNAILKGVPKAFWSDLYEAARKTIMGDFQTLANRRAAALAAFQKFGVKPEQIFSNLGVRGEEDITLDNLVTLRGMLTALREGDSTPEQMFPSAPEPAERSAQAALKTVATGKKDEPKAEAVGAPVSVPDAIAMIDTIATGELIGVYVDALPDAVKNDERITVAVKKRIEALKPASGSGKK